MTGSEGSEFTEIKEWRGKFTWLDPAIVSLDGESLHWRKISPDEVSRSFKALDRLRPYLRDADIKDESDARVWRDKLKGLKDALGQPLFDDEDLRFFDVYFGGNHIRVERVGSEYHVVNGRHRLWLAQRQGIRELPVFLVQPVRRAATSEIPKEVSTMAGMDLYDIERESEEQKRQAEQMEQEVESHKERVDKLVKIAEELKASTQEIVSDSALLALQEVQQAKAETERRLQEIREQKEQLLEENEQRTREVQQAYDQRKEKAQKINYLLFEAQGEIRGYLEAAHNALEQDTNRLAIVWAKLREARSKLEALNI